MHIVSHSCYLLNSIKIPVILSVPNPSLAAKLVGHILSIIIPKTPYKPLGAIDFLSGDLLAEALLNFPVGDLVVTVVPFVKLFLPIAEDEPLVVGEVPVVAELNESDFYAFFMFW